MDPIPTPQTGNNPTHVRNSEDFHKYLAEAGGKLVVVHFHSDESHPSKEMMSKCKVLAAAHQDVVFLKVNIEQEDLAERYNVSMTPTFLFLKYGDTMELITGANELRLEHLIRKLKR